MPEEKETKKDVTKQPESGELVITPLSPTGETRREFYEKNPKIKFVVLTIAVLSPFLGLLVSGVVGLTIGLLLSLISYLLSPRAVTKIREIQRF